MRLVAGAIGVLMPTLGWAGPVHQTHSDLAWLPIAGPWIGVELAADADLESLKAGLKGGYSLSDGSERWWRVPAANAPELAGRAAVRRLWGLPEPTPPPDDADLAPTTPDFVDQQVWLDDLDLRPVSWWPGGTGRGVAVADVEYGWDPAHEDLVNNPAIAVVGTPSGRFLYHGNACLGLVGAADDGFGTTGAAPDAELMVSHPTFDGGIYDVAEAILLTIPELQAGDVMLIEQQIGTVEGLGPVSAEPATANAIRLAVEAGIIVIEPTGNGAVNLDSPSFNGWFSGEGQTGSIMVTHAATDGTLLDRSNTGSRVDLFARGHSLVTPDDGSIEPTLFFPDNDRRQAYTGGFGGSSGASAQIAGLAAALQGIALAHFGEPVTPLQMRQWLKATGQAPTNNQAIGVRPQGERVVRAYLVP